MRLGCFAVVLVVPAAIIGGIIGSCAKFVARRFFGAHVSPAVPVAMSLVVLWGTLAIVVGIYGWGFSRMTFDPMSNVIFEITAWTVTSIPTFVFAATDLGSEPDVRSKC